MKDLKQKQLDARLDSVDTALKAARQLYSFGVKGYEDILSEPGKWFNYYFDMEMEELHKEIESMSADASKRIHELHPPQEKTIYRELGEDEMDKEE